MFFSAIKVANEVATESYVIACSSSSGWGRLFSFVILIGTLADYFCYYGL